MLKQIAVLSVVLLSSPAFAQGQCCEVGVEYPPPSPPPPTVQPPIAVPADISRLPADLGGSAVTYTRSLSADGQRENATATALLGGYIPIAVVVGPISGLGVQAQAEAFQSLLARAYEIERALGQR